MYTVKNIDRATIGPLRYLIKLSYKWLNSERYLLLSWWPFPHSVTYIYMSPTHFYISHECNILYIITIIIYWITTAISDTQLNKIIWAYQPWHQELKYTPIAWTLCGQLIIIIKQLRKNALIYQLEFCSRH